jgi:hypothetical protein
MKKLFSQLIVFMMFLFPTHIFASQLADRISDEVLDSIITAQEKYLNSSILAEICKSPKILEPDYASAALQKQILDEVHAIANQRGLKDYNAVEIRELAELEFQAFIDGSRYGVFVSKNFRNTSGKPACSAEIMQTVKESQQKLLKMNMYRLVDRK